MLEQVKHQHLVEITLYLGKQDKSRMDVHSETVAVLDVVVDQTCTKQM